MCKLTKDLRYPKLGIARVIVIWDGEKEKGGGSFEERGSEMVVS